MSDYIKLGIPGDLRDYTLQDIRQYNASLANPFAARVDTQSEFGALDAYSEWVVQDWQAGVGKKKPDAGGMLYSHMDTRFPSQMILPLGFDYPYSALHPSGGLHYAPGDHTIAVGQKIATAFLTDGTARTFLQCWVYLDAADGTTVTLQLYSSSADLPNAVLDTGTAIVTKNRPGPTWLYITMGVGTALSTTTTYYLALSGDATLTIPKTENFTNSYVYTGSSWVPDYGFSWLTSYVSVQNYLGYESGDGHILFEDGEHFLDDDSGGIRLSKLVTTRGRVFASYGSTVVELTNDTLTSILTTSFDITDMLAVNGIVYVAYGGGYKTYTLSSGATADVSSTPTQLLAIQGGFLWRSYENDLYQNDGSGWVQLDDTVGPEGYEVRGMAGLAESLYLSTDFGLYYVAPGDFIRAATKWPTIDGRNGRGMTEWMGALYIPLAEDIVRYGQDGSVVQVGLRQGEELPHDIQGAAYFLFTTNYFLLASVEPADPAGQGSLWAYNGQGWHNIGLLPNHVAGGAVLVDTDEGFLYWGGGGGLIGRARYPSNVVNPIRDRGTKQFARHGWIEQDRFYGGFVRLDKDFESIYMDTESMGESGSIAPYWIDDESTDWELLGVATTEDEELRWDEVGVLDYTTRPNSKWVRVGFLMRTDDVESTPILRAHSLKFHSMTGDRWRWNLIIPISASQQQLDGSLNTYTIAQRKTHLEGLLRRVPPCIFEDVDGTQYEVKVIAASRTLSRAENIGGAKSLLYLYSITIEQVTDAAYA